MSGVEAAGFVLAVFPLLISAAEDYKRGFEPLRKWKRFRKEFIVFIDAVDIEKHLFSQMLERFLISAEVPQEELRALMNPSVEIKTEYIGWAAPELVMLFQTRLGPAYDAFVSTLGTMRNLMTDLEDVLCLRSGEATWADKGASQWDFQLKRIRLSFSDRGPLTLGLLETHNRKLRELLDSTDKLESLKNARTDTSWGNLFESIRQHATSLHTAIKKSWNCGCSSPHNADLRLQCRSKKDTSSSFNMTFEALQTSSAPRVRRREIIFNVKESQELASRNTPSSFSSHSSSTELLRRNFESKSDPKIPSKFRPVLASSMSDLPVGTLKSSTQSSSRSNSGHPTIRSMLSHTNGSVNEGADKSESSRNWLSKLGMKPKKSVRIYLPEPVTVTKRPPPLIDQPREPPDLQSDSGASTDMPKILIHNLCSLISCSDQDPADNPGLLVDDQNCKFGVKVLPKFDVYDNALVSLDTLLRSNDDSKLSRHQRYQIASILASSVLQLQSTPWLTERLDKRHILFSKRGVNIVPEHPYIRHSFVSANATQPVPRSVMNQAELRFAVRNSLSSLGIVLLELCFGQVIENHSSWSTHLGTDGRPHGSTDYMTARDWVDSVSHEDPEFDNVIKHCIFCMFHEKADWNNKKFTSAVYCNVVEPLENMKSKKWPET